MNESCVAIAAYSPVVNFTLRNFRYFWKKTQKTDSCWWWKGSLNTWGYGRAAFGGKNYGAHRVSWMMFRGNIPDGLCVLHKCHHPACVNPDHLYLGTVKTNNDEKEALGRGAHPKGEKHGRSKLDVKSVISIRTLNAQGVSSYKLAKRFLVATSTVARIVRRKLWDHIP